MSYRGRAQYGQNNRGRLQYDKKLEVTLGEEIVEGCKIIEVRILEDIEVVLEMTAVVEVEEGPEIGSIQVTLDEIKEAVVDLNQVQEQVLKEIELDALGVRSTIIVLKHI